MAWSISTPELDDTIEKYEKHFNEDYPIDYLDNRSDPDYHINRIKDCIASDTPVPLSEYEEFLDCLM
ncbi:hypothetical protein FACS1894187_19820 [Synergistales bacterium]|nr:hypothetical protein FACS1894187_19820 [Synergistales bacterium]